MVQAGPGSVPSVRAGTFIGPKKIEDMREPKVLAAEEGAGGHSYEDMYTNDKCRRALQKLNDYGMKIFRINRSTVNDIIESFSENKLEEVDPENACQSHRCH